MYCRLSKIHCWHIVAIWKLIVKGVCALSYAMELYCLLPLIGIYGKSIMKEKSTSSLGLISQWQQLEGCSLGCEIDMKWGRHKGTGKKRPGCLWADLSASNGMYPRAFSLLLNYLCPARRFARVSQVLQFVIDPFLGPQRTRNWWAISTFSKVRSNCQMLIGALGFLLSLPWTVEQEGRECPRATSHGPLLPLEMQPAIPRSTQFREASHPWFSSFPTSYPGPGTANFYSFAF